MQPKTIESKNNGCGTAPGNPVFSIYFVKYVAVEPERILRNDNIFYLIVNCSHHCLQHV